jgi:Uma2 family endonuclease
MQTLKKIRLTSSEFEALPESDFPTELLEGELFVRDIPNIGHQRVLLRIFDHLSSIAPNGECFAGRVSVRLDDANYYQPDVLWVAKDSLCEITPDGLNGAPDLVVEVLSPGTAKVDRGLKFRRYQSSGVREYWMVEPDLHFMEVWWLVNGVFVQYGVYEADESFLSPVLGREFSLAGIFGT